MTRISADSMLMMVQLFSLILYYTSTIPISYPHTLEYVTLTCCILCLKLEYTLKVKHLFKCFDIPSQHWYFCYAYSKAQAEVLLRNQILAVNGKYNYQQLQEVKK